MKPTYLIILFLPLLLSGCVLPPLGCLMGFEDFEQRYAFACSKEELKDRVVEAYSYDKSLCLLNLGATVIENKAVNAEYRQSVEVWLDKQQWDEVQSEVRQNTPDSLSLIIGKHHSRKQIQLGLILAGEGQQSTLTIHRAAYQSKKACNKDKEYYKLKVSQKVEHKLIQQLR